MASSEPTAPQISGIFINGHDRTIPALLAAGGLTVLLIATSGVLLGALATVALLMSAALALLMVVRRLAARGLGPQPGYPGIHIGGRDLTGVALTLSALVALAALLAAGGGPLGSALATFALAVALVLAIVSWRRLVALRRARRATDRERTRLDEAQLAFIIDASHQLRTPLAALRLRLDDLASRLDGTPLSEPVDAALVEVERLSDLAGGLLVLTAEPGKVEATSLAGIVREVAATYRPQADARGVLLVVDEVGDSRIRIPNLDQAVGALIENAVLYADPETTVTVTVRGSRLEVADGGPGISDEEADEVFDRFRRGSAASRHPQGMGLGLAIASAIVERAGGSASLQNRQDTRGALAVLELPEEQRSLPRASPRSTATAVWSTRSAFASSRGRCWASSARTAAGRRRRCECFSAWPARQAAGR